MFNKNKIKLKVEIKKKKIINEFINCKIYLNFYT